MRTKLFLIACAAIIICATSCKEEKSKGRIEDAFMEYVKTDFDDPDDFVEITKIGEPDTLGFDAIRKVADFVEKYKYMLSEDEMKDAENAYNTLYSDTTYILITYPIKVRQRTKEGLVVRDYWVIDDNGKKIWAQDHELKNEEAPEFMRVILEYSKKILGK